MKYFLCLLMLTTIAYAQDTPVFAEPNGMTNKGSTVNFSGGLSVAGSLAYVSLDTAWLLSHGWKLVDTVKWKPFYQKKKHRHWFPGMESTKGYKEASKSMDSIFNTGDLFVTGKDGQLGRPLPHKNTHRSDCDPPCAGCRYDSAGYTFVYDGERWFNWTTAKFEDNERLTVKGTDVQFGGPLKSNTQIRDTVATHRVYIREMWPNVNETYPWWKKGLWVLLGIFLSAVVLVIVEVIRAKDLFRFPDPYPPDYDQLGSKN